MAPTSIVASSSVILPKTTPTAYLISPLNDEQQPARVIDGSLNELNPLVVRRTLFLRQRRPECIWRVTWRAVSETAEEPPFVGLQTSDQGRHLEMVAEGADFCCGQGCRAVLGSGPSGEGL